MIEEHSVTYNESKLHAQAAFQGLQLVLKFMEQRKNTIEGVFSKSETNDRDACLKGLWYRAFAWIETLSILNNEIAFQAFSAANRALLEICVDMILLHGDKTNLSGWKMFWWSKSEKLKSAELVLSFYQSRALQIPDEHHMLQDFIHREKLEIELMRDTLWGIKKHPPYRRWTRNDLSSDVKEADKICFNLIQEVLGKGFEEYYETEYRRLNWYIHSGVSSVWNMPAEAFIDSCFINLMNSANLAILSTKVILKDFGLTQYWNDLNEILENLEFHRALLLKKAKQDLDF